MGLPELHPESPGFGFQDAIQEGSSPYVAALQYRAARGWVATLLAAPCLRAPAGLQRATPSGPPHWPLATPFGGRFAGGQVPFQAPRRKLAIA